MFLAPSWGLEDPITWLGGLGTPGGPVMGLPGLEDPITWLYYQRDPVVFLLAKWFFRGLGYQGQKTTFV